MIRSSVMVRTWLFDLYYAKVWVYLKSTSHHVFVVSGGSRISGKGGWEWWVWGMGRGVSFPRKIFKFCFWNCAFSCIL